MNENEELFDFADNKFAEEMVILKIFGENQRNRKYYIQSSSKKLF